MQRILTGLQPTGRLTLGSYIGAIKQMVQYQEQYESYIFVADLHALTIPQDVEELHRNIKEFIALYIACGIDPDKNIIYIQSENEYIPCISWLLECNTYYGELGRMIQFKEKSKQNVSFSAGLLTYPCLMAADILSMDANFVPVGIDQKQHVEIAKVIAERFNKKYGNTFVTPECLITKTGTKIMDLQNPEHKMSKSEDNKKGVIDLLDREEDIRKKIMSATTDSESVIKYDPDNKAGISNLINIYSALTDMTINDVEEKFKDYNYGNFKKKVADVAVDTLLNIQKKYNDIINSKELDTILDKGIEISRKQAKEKYDKMKKLIGVYR